MPTIETPIIESLPKELLDGAFIFHHALSPKAYYLFWDGQFSADLQHILGWARQAIHSLNELKAGTEANWLFGHGLHLLPQNEKLYPVPDTYPVYEVSGGSNLRFNKPELLQHCGEIASGLEKADIHADQWGAKSTNEWPDIIASRHLSKKNKIHSFMLKHMSPLELRTFLDNVGNEEHHPVYAKKVG